MVKRACGDGLSTLLVIAAPPGATPRSYINLLRDARVGGRAPGDLRITITSCSHFDWKSMVVMLAAGLSMRRWTRIMGSFIVNLILADSVDAPAAAAAVSWYRSLITALAPLGRRWPVGGTLPIARAAANLAATRRGATGPDAGALTGRASPTTSPIQRRAAIWPWRGAVLGAPSCSKGPCAGIGRLPAHDTNRVRLTTASAQASSQGGGTIGRRRRRGRRGRIGEEIVKNGLTFTLRILTPSPREMS